MPEALNDSNITSSAGAEPSGTVARRSFLKAAGASALLLPAAGGGLSLFLSACSSSSSSKASSTTAGAGSGPTMISKKLQTPFGLIPSFIEFYVAKEQGFWKKHGLDISIQGGTGTASAVQSVLGGSTAYSRASGIDSINGIANSAAPVITVGMAFQRSEFSVVSLASKPINTAKDMAGKTIGVVSPSGATQELLDLILTLEGIDAKSVSQPTVGVGAAPYQLAKSGKIDGWIALDTDIKTIELSGAKLVTFSTDKYAPMPADNYLVANSLVSSEPDAISRFLAGIVDAMDFAAKPANLDKVISSAQAISPEMTRAELTVQVPIMADDWTAGGTKKPVKLYPDEWTAAQKLMIKAGTVKKAVGIDKLINTSFIDKIYGS